MRNSISTPFTFALLALLSARGYAADTLSTGSLSTCLTDSDIQVNKLDISFTRSTKELVFDVSGTNNKEQNVTASLSVTAYGRDVYHKDFDPCDAANYVSQLCPVPSGTFSATGSQQIPDDFVSQIPSIAFTIPDLDGMAKLELKSKDDNKEVACIKSELSNGKSAEVAGVSWAAAGMAGAALALSGLSALGAAGHAGSPTSSPGFGEVMGWFHTMATNGMLSVNYPQIYRSFSKNFAFSTGLVPLAQMQHSIDSFRRSTGGNLTENNYDYFKELSSTAASNQTKRSLDMFLGAARLIAREVETSVNDTASSNSTSSDQVDIFTKDGLSTLSNELLIPQSNTFMTVLLIFAIVIAAITVGILLVKVILELWALNGSFPKMLADFRDHYWGMLARTITNLILILYSIWVMYCVYQFSSGDSWAAQLLAGVTLAIFTAVLGFFTFRIVHLARKYKKSEGDASSLYENKETWRKYSLFYDNYKKGCWWLFIPVILYMLIKGCIIAGANGHGMIQSTGQLVVEALMLILLLWHRPYVAKSTQWINITIQVVRVLSVACVLVFVDQLGLSQTTKTVTGVVLIVMQSALTGILAILIAVNAIILCCRENPHLKQRKEAEKMNRDIDDLTPLDARESLLMDHPPRKDYNEMSNFNFTGPYEPYRDTDRLVDNQYHDNPRYGRNVSRDSRGSSNSRDSHGSPEGRHPTKPGYGFAY
ncbi:transient receptor potential ion channel family protein [Aspergillus undulatus]|uniref:transient receptor potential ion channel family protein n=1 Tax=Aspergillus undulatus TaxID=1810928 RepID=UPI003CCDE75A